MKLIDLRKGELQIRKNYSLKQLNDMFLVCYSLLYSLGEREGEFDLQPTTMVWLKATSKIEEKFVVYVVCWVLQCESGYV